MGTLNLAKLKITSQIAAHQEGKLQQLKMMKGSVFLCLVAPIAAAVVAVPGDFTDFIDFNLSPDTKILSRNNATKFTIHAECPSFPVPWGDCDCDFFAAFKFKTTVTTIDGVPPKHDHWPTSCEEDGIFEISISKGAQGKVLLQLSNHTIENLKVTAVSVNSKGKRVFGGSIDSFNIRTIDQGI